jgi:hypothetical protein
MLEPDPNWGVCVGSSDEVSGIRVPGKVVTTMGDEKEVNKKEAIEVRELEKLEPTGGSPGFRPGTWVPR